MSFFETEYWVGKLGILKRAVDMKAKQERTGRLVHSSTSKFREGNAYHEHGTAHLDV